MLPQPNLNTFINKTKCVRLSKDTIRCNVVIEIKPIKQVAQFRYLGMDMSRPD